MYTYCYITISQDPGVEQHALFQCELRSMRREDGLRITQLQYAASVNSSTQQLQYAASVNSSITQLQYAASVNSSTQHDEHLAYCSTHFFSESSAACDARMPSPHRSPSEPPPTV
jgi:hypothetical protein